MNSLRHVRKRLRFLKSNYEKTHGDWLNTKKASAMLPK